MASDGAVTGVSVGDCTITVTLRKPGYSDEAHSYNAIAVGAGSLDSIVSWSPQASGTVGTSLALTAVSGTAGSDTIVYSVTDADTTGCAFGSGNATAKRTLSFTNTGTCKVKATVAREHYTTWDSGEKSITVGAGTITGGRKQ